MELVGQSPLDLGRDRGREEAGHEPGMGLEGRHLAGIPVPRLGGVEIQGADHPPVQLHGHAQGRVHALAEQDLGELLPVGIGVDVGDGRWEPLAEGHRTGALGQAFLAVLNGLSGLVGGTGPAQLPVGVDQHESGRSG